MPSALRDFWWARGWCADGLDWAERVLALVELSDTSRATVLDHAAALAYAGGQHGAAREYVEAGLDLRQRCGTIREAALSLNHLAAILRWGHADADAAQAVYYRSLSAAVQSGDRLLIAAAVMPLGTLALDRDDIEGAEVLLRAGLQIYLDLEFEVALPLAFEQFAAVAATRGQASRAVKLATAGATWRTRLQVHASPYVSWLAAHLARAQSMLDLPEVEAARAVGASMSLQAAAAYALTSA